MQQEFGYYSFHKNLEPPKRPFRDPANIAVLQKVVYWKSRDMAAHYDLLRDYSSEASGYFGSIRIPATLIAGSSLGALFTFSGVQLENKSAAELLILRLYHAFVLTSFALALSTIIISTSATITMLHGRFDARAETAYELLRREFDFEFSITRWTYLVALISFIAGVNNRVILEFNLLGKDRRFHLLALVSTMVSIATNMLSYINRTLYCWPNLWHLTIHVMKLFFYEALSEGNALQTISLLSGVVALLTMAKVTLFTVYDCQADRKTEKKIS